MRLIDFPDEKLRADTPWVETPYIAEERHAFFVAPVKFTDSRLSPDWIIGAFVLLIFALVLAARAYA